MALIQGIDILLYEPIQTGKDGFHAPVFEEVPVTVKNVLVFPAESDSSDVIGQAQLNSKRLRYTLCIPKDDNHIWEDRTVEFFGHKWNTVGLPEEWISGLLPLGWNKRIGVERYE